MDAVIFLPQFALQAVLRSEPELSSKPVALLDPAVSSPVILQLTDSAREHGVVEGLTTSQAVARCPDLLVKNRSEAQEQAATEVLLQTAYAFSPRIESTAPGVCTLDLRGLRLEEETARQTWAMQIHQHLACLGLEAQIGYSNTPALALLMARAARPVLVGAAQEDSVGALPMALLEPPAEMAAILRRWGIATIGEFLRLGKANVLERLGREALGLFEQVNPAAGRPLRLVTPPETFQEQAEFEVEVETLEPLLFVLNRFIQQLTQRLALAGRVPSELGLTLYLSSGNHYEHQFRIPAPTNQPTALLRMLQTHLENVRTPAPIVSLSLSAKSAAPLAQQFGLFEAVLRNPNRFEETLARLSALCGSDCVGTPVLRPTHKPDDFEMKPPEFGAANGAGKKSSHGLQLRRFRPAIAASVEMRNRQPAVIRSALCQGPIREALGPFLMSGDWWDNRRWAREEWDIQTPAGALYRVVCSAGAWSVEGVYD